MAFLAPCAFPSTSREYMRQINKYHPCTPAVFASFPAPPSLSRPYAVRCSLARRRLAMHGVRGQRSPRRGQLHARLRPADRKPSQRRVLHRQATSMPHFGPQTPLTHPYAIHPSRAGHSPPLSMHRIPAGRRSPLRTITRQKTMATTCASFSFLLLFTILFAPRIMLAVVR